MASEPTADNSEDSVRACETRKNVVRNKCSKDKIKIFKCDVLLYFFCKN